MKSSHFPVTNSPTSSRRGLRTENMSRVTLRVNLSVTSTRRGADDIENTASSAVACWTVFTQLSPGNALIKFVTVCYFMNMWNRESRSRVAHRTVTDCDTETKLMSAPNV
jgi:hypothetical protein